MPNLGLRDIPLEKLEDESLGLSDYAHALSDFILQCETPLTIALQGDWGSGKTSMMNLIKMNIEQAKNIHTIWFNTWQFSQFEMQSELSISMLSHFVDALDLDENKTAKKLLSGMRKLGKFVAAGAADILGGEAAKEIVEKVADKIGGGELDSAMQIKKLKTEIENLVKTKIAKDNKDRIVVFVDDLDRLLPEKAVELLEVFKLFLDTPGCVYVLACDYQVVSQGLKKKFGVVSDELKGKSFFDKIIQLPFSMPLGQYDVKNYIKRLLDNMGVSYKDDDITVYADMVNYSIGFNPRSMKRLFNSLLLLNLVAEKRRLFESQDGAKKEEKQRIIFGMLCLQTAYETLYYYMQKNMDKLDNKFFNGIRNEKELETSDDFAELRNQIQEASGRTELRRLSQFMEAFFDAIQLESDVNKNELSKSEIEALKQVLQFSAITSTDATVARSEMNWDMRYKNRDMAKAFIEELSNKYETPLKQLNTNFRIYQSRTSSGVNIYFDIVLKENKRFCVGLNFDEDSSGAFLVARNRDSVEFIEDWAKKNCSDVFPKIECDRQAWETWLWEHKDMANITREQQENKFKEEAMKTLDILFPKLTEGFSDKLLKE
jgi:hypothetical protein